MAPRNKEWQRRYNAAYREKNKTALVARSKAYREANLEAIKARSKKKYQARRAHYVKLAKQRYATNRVQIMAAHKERHRKNPLRNMLVAAKVRAKRYGITFSLRPGDLFIPPICPILGIPLAVGVGLRSPGSPSIDRIDPKGAYSKENCRIISFRANTLKNDGTIEDHERIIAYMRGKL